MTKKKMLPTFKDYLKNASLSGKHNLTPSGNLYFHWANWSESCKYQQQELSSKKGRSKKLKNLEKELDEYKSVPVWLSIHRERHEITLYDLYMGYLDPRIKANWFDVHNETLVSLESISGPYITLHSMRWFHKEVYDKFIYRKILINYMPLRSFRLGVDIPVFCRFDDSPLNEVTLNLYQLSKYGCVFKLKGQKDYMELRGREKISLYMDLNPFKQTLNSHVEDLIRHFSKVNFNIIDKEKLSEIVVEDNIVESFGNKENSRFSNGEDFYIFIPYKAMVQQTTEENLFEILSKFVEKIETHFLDEMKEEALKKAA